MRIILVHGLGRTPLSLFGLAATLRNHGHKTQFFIYSATVESFESIANRLVRRLKRLARSPQPVGLIGHSLGGILLRRALPEVPDLFVHHLVMIGSPMQSPRIARLAWKWRLFRMLARSSGLFLASPEKFLELPPLTVSHTMFAGTAGPRGRFSPFGTEQNDGLVEVAETRIEPTNSVYEYPVWHTFIMNDRRVQRRILSIMGSTGLTAGTTG